MNEVGKSRLAALLGGLAVAFAGALVNRIGLTEEQTVAAATVVASVASLLIPSIRRAVTESDGKLQSIIGLLVGVGADALVLGPLGGNADLESALIGVITLAISLFAPAVHLQNDPAPAGA